MENEGFIFFLWLFFLHLILRMVYRLIELFDLLWLPFLVRPLPHCHTAAHDRAEVVTLVDCLIGLIHFLILLSLHFAVAQKHRQCVTLTASTLTATGLPAWTTLIFIRAGVHGSVAFFALCFKDFTILNFPLNMFFLISVFINVHNLMFFFHKLFIVVKDLVEFRKISFFLFAF